MFHVFQPRNNKMYENYFSHTHTIFNVGTTNDRKPNAYFKNDILLFILK